MNAEKALKTLEYQKILDMLKTHVSSERARELADETRPTDDKNLAESWLTETFEADKSCTSSRWTRISQSTIL